MPPCLLLFQIIKLIGNFQHVDEKLFAFLHSKGTPENAKIVNGIKNFGKQDLITIVVYAITSTKIFFSESW